MAEVPLPTPTQVPVPSTDIRNAVFAGAKLDEEVTGTGEFYTDRLGVKRLTNTGRNNQFDAAQLDRANRFEQFLLSSGYVFLGDYEDGPFQFSARNLYIRYNNQYYRLNAATDVGFTTTGTDATSFVNDVTHFVLMDGDTLRQNLGSGDGQKLVGKCATLDALRTTEPEYHGQEIILFRAVDDGPVLNERLYYDATDTTSEENGFSVFVTPNGARWKPVDSSNINVWLAGFNPDTNNLAACINKISQWYVTKSIEDGQINNRKAVIFVPSLGYKTTYIITETIKLPPSLVELRTAGDMIFDFSSIPNVDGIVCSHEYPGLTYGKGNNLNGDSADSGGAVINPIGVLYLKGPGVTR
ncbi:TPA: hypothetical protein PCB63_001614, partial [Klebsiella quasipneumoniae]|nr:hypothetical protein [Klebsiella quasipneumoniae]